MFHFQLSSISLIRSYKNSLTGTRMFFSFALFITVPANISTSENLWATASCCMEGIPVGDNVFINSYCHIGCINKIVIGNNVMIGSGVLITDHQHGILAYSDTPVADRELVSKGPVIIGDNVWIGQRAQILKGVSIGDGAIIAAGAIVTHDIPSNCVAVGVPAKVVRQNIRWTEDL